VDYQILRTDPKEFSAFSDVTQISADIVIDSPN